MAELINGDGTIPEATSGYVQHAISSSTNASPIAVTFSSAHGFYEGDTIEVEGHATNTNANGLWRVHVTGANTVQLVGSTGNGVGGATGYAVDYSVSPLLQVGDDGDAASAEAIDTPYEGLFNFVPYLFKRVGQYRVLNIFTQPQSGSGGVALNASSPTDLGLTRLTDTWYSSVTSTDAWLVLLVTTIQLTADTAIVYPNYKVGGSAITTDTTMPLYIGTTSSWIPIVLPYFIGLSIGTPSLLSFGLSAESITSTPTMNWTNGILVGVHLRLNA